MSQWLQDIPVFAFATVVILVMASGFVLAVSRPRNSRKKDTYIQDIIGGTRKIRHLKLFVAEEFSVDGVSFDGGLAYEQPPSGVAYIEGIKSALEDAKCYPINPVVLYTHNLKPDSYADQFLTGAIRTYMMRQIRVRHVDVNEKGTFGVFDSADGGTYSQFMLERDLERLGQSGSILWR